MQNIMGDIDPTPTPAIVATVTNDVTGYKAGIIVLALLCFLLIVVVVVVVVVKCVVTLAPTRPLGYPVAHTDTHTMTPWRPPPTPYSTNETISALPWKFAYVAR